jgi:hypothetical protein
MSDRSRSFVERCLAGEAFANEIDACVESWHEGNDPRPLDEFLGFTQDEYAIWVERPAALTFILFARKHSLALGEALGFGEMADEGFAIAARAPSNDEANEIVDWLKKTGRLTRGA